MQLPKITDVGVTKCTQFIKISLYDLVQENNRAQVSQINRFRPLYSMNPSTITEVLNQRKNLGESSLYTGRST